MMARVFSSIITRVLIAHPHAHTHMPYSLHVCFMSIILAYSSCLCLVLGIRIFNMNKIIIIIEISYVLNTHM